ncbi:MAG TPA: low molecular weight protein-tyrosine-phosphatase [Sphingobacteriaceae bacterium]|nr:low molecular weight protein-tyrosine-phosphatase [Sphingobacteriaceae bacterium]
MSEPTRILFVCLGNICRSPLAEGVFKHLVDSEGLSDRFYIDSAGTGNWHVGRPAHPQSRRIAQLNGIQLTSIARQIQKEELDQWHYIVVMDDKNYSDIMAMEPTSAQVVRLGDFDPEGPGIVPDPYGYDDRVYEQVYNQIYRSCRAFLDALNNNEARMG